MFCWRVRHAAVAARRGSTHAVRRIAVFGHPSVGTKSNGRCAANAEAGLGEALVRPVKSTWRDSSRPPMRLPS